MIIYLFLKPFSLVKPHANGSNIVDQQLPTLLDVTCCARLHTLLHVVECCCVFLRKVWNRLNFSANNYKHFFCSFRSVAQQCWIRLHSSSNIVGAAHAHYAWFTKTYGLYPSHDALQVPTLLGVVASVCTRPYVLIFSRVICCSPLLGLEVCH